MAALRADWATWKSSAPCPRLVYSGQLDMVFVAQREVASAPSCNTTQELFEDLPLRSALNRATRSRQPASVTPVSALA